MMAISSIPCKAGDDCCDDEYFQKVSVNITSFSKEKIPNEQKKEPCSPLFPCSSHCIFVMAHYYKLPTYWTTMSHTYSFEYINKPIQSFGSSVWRPPLLG